jgi:glucose/arabinose dehydrogenase
LLPKLITGNLRISYLRNMRWGIVFLLAFVYTEGISQEVTYAEAFPGITFTTPVELASPPDNSKRFFVVQQNGIIKVFPNKKGLIAADVKDFLNLSSKVIYGGERGLLGLAFHPQFQTNGYFYVNYTRPTPFESVISRFRVKADNANEADPTSEVILFTQAQPYTNHNGGKLAFGPDGYLYISLGDGGSAGDPQNNAQNLTNLLGKILRIDVDNEAGSLKYSIPVSNPFKNTTHGQREEIFAYGLRNVWKFSIDTTTGTVWAADVGQNVREEINLIVNGGNYGWRLMEGTLCYNPATNCNPGNLILPIFEYPHTNGNSSITGGHVYRGIQIPEWQGDYLYGDYVSGRIWKLRHSEAATTNAFLTMAGGFISSFGEDHNKEPYVVLYSTANTGKIFRYFPSPPLAPDNLTLTYQGESNTLTWTDESNNEVGFIIERSPTGSNSYSVIDTLPYNSTEFLDVLGTDGTDYTYRIKSINDGGESSYAYPENIILGITEQLFSQVYVYPNPAQEFIHLEIPTALLPAQVRITNLMRQELYLSTVSAINTRIDLSVSAGIYLIEIKCREGSVVRKLKRY